ncbi:MAG TPA: arginase family protein [Actinophytocola sp.]|uniref:arginase family protein n=1 Tax=Actinophytocola sp. TaxID=1872138 RepID=UPI002DDD2CB5|nr:arginase family protein [Actinophytocola sp.]HEV2781956.1 arginase family protein [Actinophytocola sp.]
MTTVLCVPQWQGSGLGDSPRLAVGARRTVELVPADAQAPIAAARARHGEALTVLWIDAHPDLCTPQTLRSGSFHGMVLRTLLGDGPAPLVPEQPLTASGGTASRTSKKRSMV